MFTIALAGCDVLEARYRKRLRALDGCACERLRRTCLVDGKGAQRHYGLSRSARLTRDGQVRCNTWPEGRVNFVAGTYEVEER